MPQGGAKDETPPVLSLEDSTPSKQTNFSERKMEFKFDEWVQLSNPAKEVFVSPPLAYPPKVSVRGKVVTFEFSENEVLKENTTYQINFGKAIKDLTEGNVVENLVFLFSTGDKIDELFVKGEVKDAITGTAVKDVVVMLYDNLSDTCFTTIKPLYLTRTDEEGKFALENLRADTFQIFALDDQNVSYTYDVQTEQVAFLDSLIILKDTLQENILLKLFDEADDPQLIDGRQRTQGLVKVSFQNIPDSIEVRLIDDIDSIRVWHETVGDTVKIWHDSMTADSLFFEIGYGAVFDTIKARKAKKTLKKSKLNLVTKSITMLSQDSMLLEFNLPVSRVDTSRLSLQDTSEIYKITEVSSEGRFAYIKGDLRPNRNYDLVLDSFAVESWYGQQYLDSMSISVQTLDPEKFGNILLKVTKADSVAYIVQLIEKDEIRETVNLVDQNEINFSKLPSGKYKLKIIQDLNSDGQWTAGSIAEKKLPERTKELNLEDLKSGWDLEDDLDLEELFYGADSK